MDSASISPFGVRPRIGIFFGSTSYGTRDAAERIHRAIGTELAALHDVARSTADDLVVYDHLIFGTSTWGEGFLQHDWDRFIGELARGDLAGKTVAVFGLGDQVVWDRTFVDAMGIVHDRLVDAGARVVGSWPTDGYSYTASRAERDGRFVGLALDKMNQRDLHDERIAGWVAQVLGEFEAAGAGRVGRDDSPSQCGFDGRGVPAGPGESTGPGGSGGSGGPGGSS